MRQARLKVPAERPAGYYHCLSRVVDRRFIFHLQEKQHFVQLLRECERFCRVRVLTFCVMDNHFHILVEVPRRPQSLPSPEEILSDLKRLSGVQFLGAIRQRFDLLRQLGDDMGLAAYLATFHARLYDVSAFMKLLKQRFTLWYNRRHGRRGTLWEERFRSVVVEGVGDALATMAAYIDLNPVRAGLVKDPKDYHWSGYGEAIAGQQRAQLGLQAVVTGLLRGQEETVSKSLEIYRMHLYLEGDERRESTGPDGWPVRGALTREAAVKVLAAKGRLPAEEYLRCRVRYFNDGAILGSREFVDEMFRAHRGRFSPARKTGARRLKGLASPALYALRDLQRAVFG